MRSQLPPRTVYELVGRVLRTQTSQSTLAAPHLRSNLISSSTHSIQSPLNHATYWTHVPGGRTVRTEEAYIFTQDLYDCERDEKVQWARERGKEQGTLSRSGSPHNLK